jgi:chromosome segregation ATPase
MITMSVQEAKTKLLTAQAELSARQQDAAHGHERLRTLRDRVSRLRAEELLDGVSHARRISTDEKEIANLEQTLATWPDVEHELQRRIVAAEVELVTAQDAERQQTLAALAEQERELRERFAAAALALLEVSADIGDIHQQRDTMRMQVVDEYTSGKRPNQAGAPINPPLPTFQPGWLFNRQHLALAERTLRNSQ